MLIYGNKVVLRRPEPEDLPLLHEWAMDPQLELMGYAQGMLPQYRAEVEADWLPQDMTAERYIEKFMIDTRGDKRTVGFALLYEIDRENGSCRTGIMIGDRGAWGRGYGTDARIAMIHFCFQHLNMHRIWGSYLTSNDQSRRLNEKCGAYVVGRLVQETYFNGTYHDIIQTSVSRESFYARNGAALGAVAGEVVRS